MDKKQKNNKTKEVEKKKVLKTIKSLHPHNTFINSHTLRCLSNERRAYPLVYPLELFLILSYVFNMLLL